MIYEVAEYVERFCRAITDKRLRGKVAHWLARHNFLHPRLARHTRQTLKLAECPPLMCNAKPMKDIVSSVAPSPVCLR